MIVIGIDPHTKTHTDAENGTGERGAGRHAALQDRSRLAV